MPQSTICRLCLKPSTEYRNLYGDSGHDIQLYDITRNYFHPKVVDLEQMKHFRVICSQCYCHIRDFHSFESSIRLAQLQRIELEEVKREKELIIVKVEKLNDTLANKEREISKVPTGVPPPFPMSESVRPEQVPSDSDVVNQIRLEDNYAAVAKEFSFASEDFQEKIKEEIQDPETVNNNNKIEKVEAVESIELSKCRAANDDTLLKAAKGHTEAHTEDSVNGNMDLAHPQEEPANTSGAVSNDTRKFSSKENEMSKCFVANDDTLFEGSKEPTEVLAFPNGYTIAGHLCDGTMQPEHELNDHSDGSEANDYWSDIDPDGEDSCDALSLSSEGSENEKMELAQPQEDDVPPANEFHSFANAVGLPQRKLIEVQKVDVGKLKEGTENNRKVEKVANTLLAKESSDESKFCAKEIELSKCRAANGDTLFEGSTEPTEVPAFPNGYTIAGHLCDGTMQPEHVLNDHSDGSEANDYWSDIDPDGEDSCDALSLSSEGSENEKMELAQPQEDDVPPVNEFHSFANAVGLPQRKLIEVQKVDVGKLKEGTENNRKVEKVANTLLAKESSDESKFCAKEIELSKCRAANGDTLFEGSKEPNEVPAFPNGYTIAGHLCDGTMQPEHVLNDQSDGSEANDYWSDIDPDGEDSSDDVSVGLRKWVEKVANTLLAKESDDKSKFCAKEIELSKCRAANGDTLFEGSKEPTEVLAFPNGYTIAGHLCDGTMQPEHELNDHSDGSEANDYWSDIDPDGEDSSDVLSLTSEDSEHVKMDLAQPQEDDVSPANEFHSFENSVGLRKWVEKVANTLLAKEPDDKSKFCAKEIELSKCRAANGDTLFEGSKEPTEAFPFPNDTTTADHICTEASQFPNVSTIADHIRDDTIHSEGPGAKDYWSDIEPHYEDSSRALTLSQEEPADVPPANEFHSLKISISLSQLQLTEDLKMKIGILKKENQNQTLNNHKVEEVTNTSLFSNGTTIADDICDTTIHSDGSGAKDYWSDIEPHCKDSRALSSGNMDLSQPQEEPVGVPPATELTKEFGKPLTKCVVKMKRIHFDVRKNKKWNLCHNTEISNPLRNKEDSVNGNINLAQSKKEPTELTRKYGKALTNCVVKIKRIHAKITTEKEWKLCPPKQGLNSNPLQNKLQQNTIERQYVNKIKSTESKTVSTPKNSNALSGDVFIGNQHFDNFHSPKLFQCRLCDNTFPTTTKLHRHIQLYHRGNGPSKMLMFRCTLCDNSYISYNGMSNHLAMKHLINQPMHGYNYTTKHFHCKICGSTFHFEENLTKHEVQYHASSIYRSQRLIKSIR